jgi:hypothetical protein
MIFWDVDIRIIVLTQLSVVDHVVIVVVLLVFEHSDIGKLV